MFRPKSQLIRRNSKRVLLILLGSCAFNAGAQQAETDSSNVAQFLIGKNDSDKRPLVLHAYLELYYVYDFNKPQNHERPSFAYSHNRHNELALNLGLLRAEYSTEKFRARLGFMAGTYANANLAAEPGVLKNVYEASGGIKLSKAKNLWLDAGIMPSHIGFESAIGKDCWTLSRSIIADNSPYYEAGVKLGYSSGNEQLYLAVMYLNGWQRMQRPAGNNTPAFGTQISWKPKKSVNLNWSTFAGNDKPDSARQMRYFSNLYTIVQMSPKLGLIADLDYGIQERAGPSAVYDSWYGVAGIIRQSWTPALASALRAEYYYDPSGIVVAAINRYGFRCSGYSLNMDYNLNSNAMLRIEGKLLKGENDIFRYGAGFVGTNTAIMAALVVDL